MTPVGPCSHSSSHNNPGAPELGRLPQQPHDHRRQHQHGGAEHSPEQARRDERHASWRRAAAPPRRPPRFQSPRHRATAAPAARGRSAAARDRCGRRRGGARPPARGRNAGDTPAAGHAQLVSGSGVLSPSSTMTKSSLASVDGSGSVNAAAGWSWSACAQATRASGSNHGSRWRRSGSRSTPRDDRALEHARGRGEHQARRRQVLERPGDAIHARFRLLRLQPARRLRETLEPEIDRQRLRRALQEVGHLPRRRVDDPHVGEAVGFARAVREDRCVERQRDQAGGAGRDGADVAEERGIERRADGRQRRGGAGGVLVGGTRARLSPGRVGDGVDAQGVADRFEVVARRRRATDCHSARAARSRRTRSKSTAGRRRSPARRAPPAADCLHRRRRDRSEPRAAR